MIETVDTASQNTLIPEAHYIMKVLETPEKIPSGKTSYRKWKFAASLDGKTGRIITAIFFPWESYDLLIALGGEKDGSSLTKVIWDDGKVAGKLFEADIKHGTYKKNDGTEKSKYVFENIKPRISMKKDKPDPVFDDSKIENEEEEDKLPF